MTARPAVPPALGTSSRTAVRPTAAPTTWAATNSGTDVGLMPANVSENIRPTVTAGLANDDELVNQYAAPM
jgi:hypothetical protein